MKVSEKNRPSELFLGAVCRGYDKTVKKHGRVSCSDIWNEIVAECLHMGQGGFSRMFNWDKTAGKAGVNRIRTIAECIAGGFVPGLALAKDGRGREIVVEAKT
jgi:hypothetical protein